MIQGLEPNNKWTEKHTEIYLNKAIKNWRDDFVMAQQELEEFKARERRSKLKSGPAFKNNSQQLPPSF